MRKKRYRLFDGYFDISSLTSELRKENEQLKQLNNKMQCCGNCKHRRADEVVETCRKKKIYTLNKGCCEEWELAE